MEYTSKGVGNAALATGIIGTSLGALSGAGGLAGLFGQRNAPPPDPGDRPVTRYEMELWQKINEKNDEIVLLKANQYSDFKADGLQAQIAKQSEWTAAATVTLGNLNTQIQALYGITKLMIPVSNIVPPPETVAASSSTTTGG